MKQEENIQITINIAGQRIPLTVGFDQQNLVRETEKKSMQELLAMIAYQYASFYLSLSRRMDESARDAEALDAMLDDALGRLPE